MTFVDKLLEYYHLNKEEYKRLIKDVNLSNVPLYTCFKDIDKAKDRILLAIKNKEKILIYGDYDADGIFATSILLMTFRKLKYNAITYIPSRYIDGYGISVEKIIKAKEQGFSLIITVDNGVGALEAINKANELHIDMIITDHHEYKDEPNVYAFIHPFRSNLSVTTSGASVAFFLSYALLNDIDTYLLSLAGTSIVADLMPLKNENRNLLRLALKYLNKEQYKKFNILSHKHFYDEDVLSIDIIPKINAIGRIEVGKEVNYLVKYFVTNNNAEAYKIANYLEQVNERRKNISKEIISSIKINGKPNCIILKLDILVGLTGLIATRLLMEYNSPTCIFSSTAIKGIIRASIRSKYGFNLIDFFKENEDIIVNSGGHEFASGVEIKENDYELFATRFRNYSSTHPFKNSEDYIYINQNEINLTNYNILRSFSPFGASFKEPIFYLKNVNISNYKRIGNNKEHLLINLNETASIVAYNFDFNKIKDKENIDFIGKMKLKKYFNNTLLNFIVIN